MIYRTKTSLWIFDMLLSSSRSIELSIFMKIGRNNFLPFPWNTLLIIIRIKVEQLVFCVAVVEPAERDVGRKLVSKCPAQEALNDFLQSEAATSGVTQSSSSNAHSTGYVFNLN